MKITRIRLSRHRLPLDPPFPPAWDSRPRSHFDATLVRVESDSGHEGVAAGEAMAGFTGHEDLFVDHDPRALDRHLRIVDNLSFHYGRGWPLEVALWDLYGKIVGEPVWRLLGGATGGRLACYASCGTLRDLSATVEAAKAIRQAGFPALKLRFHRADWRDDVAVVEAVRDAVGPDMAILVDCNQAWRMPWDPEDAWTFKQALAVARALEALDVFWMEEPLHRADFDGMARLRAAVDLRIAGAEMAREQHDLNVLMDYGCLDVLQPDALLCGGIGGLARIFRTARDRGLEIAPHTWGNGLQLLANAQLAAGVGGCPYLEFPYDPPEWTPERRDFLLSQPITPDPTGHLQLSDAPGLGIALDDSRLQETEIEL